MSDTWQLLDKYFVEGIGQFTDTPFNSGAEGLRLGSN